jgi:MtN3 and saliva related transmembrane protein
MRLELLTTGLGIFAAILTSLSYLPQVRKALPRGSTHDLSLKTLCALTAGLVVWLVYGLMRADYVIVLSNATGAALAGIVCVCKLRDVRSRSPNITAPKTE